MIVRNDVTKVYEGIRCDKCGKSAPSTEVIKKNHGLVQMGWQCLGGKHICDGCPHDPAVAMAHAPLSR